MSTEAKEPIVVDFAPNDLPANTGIRGALRHFLMEHRALFSKVMYHSDGDVMQVIATLREELTDSERAEVEDDVRMAVEIVGQLTKLKHLG